MLERERDIFPLPKLAVETLPLRGQLCRTVERRILRRSHVQKQVNLAVDALNSMYFGHEHYVVPMPVRAVKELNHQSQRDTLEHLISRVHAAGAPPMHLSHSGAINALRVASSPYGDALSGVGEVVPMNLELLSIPEVGVDGVPIQDLLEGSAGDFIRDPENFMLQDASNWGVVSDEVASIKTYNDPQLRNKKFICDIYRSCISRAFSPGVFAPGVVLDHLLSGRNPKKLMVRWLRDNDSYWIAAG